MSAKQWIQSAIRKAHGVLADRGLPGKLALYMHSLEEPDYPAFRECIYHLRNVGYDFVGVEEFLSASESHVAFLSFDDNYRSWFQAIPLLERLGVHATFYINTLPLRNLASSGSIAGYFDRIRHLGERVPLSSSEVRLIRQAGHVIGAHTHAHTMLTALPREDAIEDIRLCKQILEETVGEEIQHFSYPFGMRKHFNNELFDYCQQIGFQTVASAIPGLQHGHQGPTRINRTLWRLDLPLESNLQNLRVDGRIFERLTGLSPLG